MAFVYDLGSPDYRVCILSNNKCQIFLLNVIVVQHTMDLTVVEFFCFIFLKLVNYSVVENVLYC